LLETHFIGYGKYKYIFQDTVWSAIARQGDCQRIFARGKEMTWEFTPEEVGAGRNSGYRVLRHPVKRTFGITMALQGE